MGPRRDGHGHHHRDGESHGHSHAGVDPALIDSRDALRTLWISLVLLGVTAAAQMVIVAISGSVALLADTVHNVGDALTAVPLAAAFLLGRRAPTERFSHGYGRAEELAGVAVLLVILFSAIYAGYEAVDRFLHPSTPSHLWLVAAAGVVGFAGNEAVAIYRIRTGRRIGSAALVADGHHARIDGVTSLAVVVGVAGIALGYPLADPVVGLLIALVIVRIVWISARDIGLRLMDGIEPATLSEVRRVAEDTAGVTAVHGARARWTGHRIAVELDVAVSPAMSVAEADALSHRLTHRVADAVAHIGAVHVRVVPTASRMV